MKRKLFLGGVTATMAAATTTGAWSAMSAAFNASLAVEDFEKLWNFVDAKYCYFGQKTTNWNAAHTYYRDPVRRSNSAREAFAVFEQLLDELYDPHTHLGNNTAHSYRLPPYDIWAEWDGAAAIVRAVRPRSPSASAGLRAGDAITSIGGSSLPQASHGRAPHFVDRSDPAVRQWLLDSILSGRHDTHRIIGVQSRDGTTRSLDCDRYPDMQTTDEIAWKIVAPHIGYIRIPTFAQLAAVQAFDHALAKLRNTDVLLIDVRGNGGGDTAVTRPIMGRFVDEKMPYCRMTRRTGKALAPAHLEYVAPRGPFRYPGKVRVLVDHWTGSAAEGFAMGLETIAKAIVVGTKMEGLGAAISHVQLPYLRSSAQISAEPVFDLDGRSRLNYLPSVRVNLENAAESDAILAAALAPALPY